MWNEQVLYDSVASVVYHNPVGAVNANSLLIIFVSVVIVSSFKWTSLHHRGPLSLRTLRPYYLPAALSFCVLKTCHDIILLDHLDRKAHITPDPSSRIKLPLLQSTPVTFLRRRSARHLYIRRLHVLLRKTCADFLVGLGVCFLAVARAIHDTLA